MNTEKSRKRFDAVNDLLSLIPADNKPPDQTTDYNETTQLISAFAYLKESDSLSLEKFKSAFGLGITILSNQSPELFSTIRATNEYELYDSQESEIKDLLELSNAVIEFGRKYSQKLLVNNNLDESREVVKTCVLLSKAYRNWEQERKSINSLLYIDEIVAMSETDPNQRIRLLEVLVNRAQALINTTQDRFDALAVNTDNFPSIDELRKINNSIANYYNNLGDIYMDILHTCLRDKKDTSVSRITDSLKRSFMAFNEAANRYKQYEQDEQNVKTYTAIMESNQVAVDFYYIEYYLTLPFDDYVIYGTLDDAYTKFYKSLRAFKENDDVYTEYKPFIYTKAGDFFTTIAAIIQKGQFQKQEQNITIMQYMINITELLGQSDSIELSSSSIIDLALMYYDVKMQEFRVPPDDLTKLRYSQQRASRLKNEINLNNR